MSLLIPVGFSRLHPALVCVCVCTCSPARGRGGNVTPKLWKPLFGNFIHPCLQPLGVSGTLQLCHIHSLWKHLLLSLRRGAELPSYRHKCFATVLLSVIPDCHEAFAVCPPCWCLQSPVSLRCCHNLVWHWSHILTFLVQTIYK